MTLPVELERDDVPSGEDFYGWLAGRLNFISVIFLLLGIIFMAIFVSNNIETLV